MSTTTVPLLTRAAEVSASQCPGDCFLYLDPSFRITFASHGAARTLRQPSDESLLAQVLWEAAPQLAGTAVEEACRRAEHDRQSIQLETCSFASETWVDVRVHPSAHGLSFFATEKVPRATAEVVSAGPTGPELASSRDEQSVPPQPNSADLYRSMVESSSEGIAASTLDGRFTMVNAAFAEIVGYTIEELLTMKYQQLTPRNWHETEGEIVRQQIVGRGHSDEYEKEYIHKNGTIVPVRIRGWLVRDTHGQPSGMCGFVHDVSVEREARQALLDSEERERAAAEAHRRQLAEIESIYASVPIGLGVLDRDLRFVRINERLAEMNGFPVSQHIGRSVRELLPQVADSAEPVLRAVFATGQPVLGFELSGETPAQPGVIRHWLESWLPIRDARGEVIGISVVCEEVTERRRWEGTLRDLNLDLERRVLERTAEARNRAKQLQALAGELVQAEERERRRLAQVLHDHLQQFLVAAKMRASLIGRRLADANMADPALAHEVDQLIDLIQQALNESRLLTAQLSPPILYDAGLGPALQWLARWQREQHGLEVTVDIDAGAEPERPEVRTFLFQAAREFLLNIVKHAGVSAAVLRLQLAHDGCVELVVEDEGSGFTAEIAGCRTTAAGGFGLFAIRERVQLFDGSMHVERSPSGGARLTIRLPSRTRSAEQPTAPREITTPGEPSLRKAGMTRIRVLLADDQEIVREGLAALLRDHGDLELVGEAADGEQAVAMAKSLRPQVVVMDAIMPKVNGLEATRRLRSECPEIRVIGLSMYSEDDMAAAMREAGAIAYLSKDGPVERLARAIRDVASDFVDDRLNPH